MNFYEKIEKLASIFLKESQTLGLGESSLSFNDLKIMAANLKSKVEQLVKDNKIEHHIYHWTNPGDKLIEALGKMSNGAPVDSNLKASAYEDYNQNIVSLFSEEDKNKLNKLFSFYTIT
jgi:hypothetical protein